MVKTQIIDSTYWFTYPVPAGVIVKMSNTLKNLIDEARFKIKYNIDNYNDTLYYLI